MATNFPQKIGYPAAGPSNAPSERHFGLCQRDGKRRRFAVCLLGLFVVSQVLLPHASFGQDVEPVSFAANGVRVVLGKANSLDSAAAFHLMEVVREQIPLLGFPEFSTEETITVSLAMEMEPGLNGRAEPRSRLLVLPQTEVFSWDESRLSRTIRHELAHIAMAEYLHHGSVPFWFREGYAEWVAGGVDCPGEARLRVAVVSRSRMGELLPRIDDFSRLTKSRLSYDFLGDLFSFVDARWRGVLQDQRLIESVRAYGIEGGIQRVLGIQTSDLQRQWWSHLGEEYGEIPPGYSCGRGPKAGGVVEG